MTKKIKKQNKTTGHEWDGIKEYDNPDPFWLRFLFYIALLFSLFYWLLFPSWPTPDNKGFLGWSSIKSLDNSLDEIKKKRELYQQEFNQATFAEILQNKPLLKFAKDGGRVVFEDNCSVCHGKDGKGNLGYPNLTDEVWIWGGDINDIYQTIKYGIRSGDDQARDSNMAAFGRDKILSHNQIEKLTTYVIALSKGEEMDGEASKLFEAHCSSCHGKYGAGNKEFGAPALNDNLWLYGGARKQIYDVIFNGRQGVMPAWHNRFDDDTIRQLAVYVFQLSKNK